MRNDTLEASRCPSRSWLTVCCLAFAPIIAGCESNGQPAQVDDAAMTATPGAMDVTMLVDDQSAVGDAGTPSWQTHLTVYVKNALAAYADSAGRAVRAELLAQEVEDLSASLSRPKALAALVSPTPCGPQSADGTERLTVEVLGQVQISRDVTFCGAAPFSDLKTLLAQVRQRLQALSTLPDASANNG
jgi:hypothetical protein